MTPFDTYITRQRSTSVATASVTSVVSTVVIVAANPNRKGCIIYNNSSAILTLAFDGNDVSTKFTTKVGANSEYQVPFGFCGAIYGAWASVNGNAYITEFI